MSLVEGISRVLGFGKNGKTDQSQVGYDSETAPGKGWRAINKAAYRGELGKDPDDVSSRLAAEEPPLAPLADEPTQPNGPVDPNTGKPI